jgi:alkylation response protein AidB-like acyl-CoA dehydrogenase
MSAAGALELVRALLAAPVEPRVDSTAALKAHAARWAGGGDTVDRAALGGLAAAGVGWAFACGYEAALARLDPALARGGAVTALCATEQGGGHPRAIRTTLTPAPAGGHVLAGTKSWVTLGADAEVLLVVASTGLDAQGRNRLRVARVPASRPGVRLEPGGATPFAPEIAHARAVFDAVAVADEELLSGDGYDAVLKPFRTIEDVHVLAAVLGWALGVARASAWERTFVDEGVGLVLLLRTLGAADPSSPATHVALAGALASVKRLLDAAPWATTTAAVRDAWARDRPLLDVASTVRAARREAAWKALG